VKPLLFLTAILLTAILIACVSATQGPAPAITKPAEVWITATQAVDFDAAMNAVGPSNVIHLIPNGTHWTKGWLGDSEDAASLKAGQTLIFHGATIKVDRSFHTLSRPDKPTRNLTVLRAVEDNIRLIGPGTLDASCDGSETVTQIGLWLGGDNFFAIYITVDGVSGCWAAGQESFAISCGDGSTQTRGSLIGCIVTNCQGTYVSAICPQGRVSIDLCRIYLPPITNRLQGYFIGYNFAGTTGTKITRSFCTNGVYAYYSDTGSDTNLSIVDCGAYNCMVGVAVYKSASQDVYLDGLAVTNLPVTLSTNAAAYTRGGFRIVNDSGPGFFYRNLNLVRDRISYVGNVRAAIPGTYALTIWSDDKAGTNIFGVVVKDCNWDNSLEVHVKCLNLTLSNNADFKRRSITYPPMVTISQ
jgi:hypothetical protein